MRAPQGFPETAAPALHIVYDSVTKVDLVLCQHQKRGQRRDWEGFLMEETYCWVMNGIRKGLVAEWG